MCRSPGRTKIAPPGQIEPLSQIKPSSQKIYITIIIFSLPKNNNRLAHPKYQKHQDQKILPQNKS
jgi:hypothetical protein